MTTPQSTPKRRAVWFLGDPEPAEVVTDVMDFMRDRWTFREDGWAMDGVVHGYDWDDMLRQFGPVMEILPGDRFRDPLDVGTS